MSNSLQELITVYQDILDTYYKDIDEADLVDAAVDGMLSSLDDPYSTYMDEEIVLLLLMKPWMVVMLGLELLFILRIVEKSLL